MQSEFAAQPVRLLKSNSVLPATLETELRRMGVDKFTGNVQLNIKDGKILGFHKNQMVSIPANEL